MATAGNNRLGGDDFDQLVVNYLIEEFQKKEGVDLSKNKTALFRLREAAEKAKKELSGVTKTEINLPFIGANQNYEPVHLNLSLTEQNSKN